MSNRPPDPPRVTWAHDEPPEPPLVYWRVVGETEWREAEDGRLLAADLPENVTIEWRAGFASGRVRYSPPPRRRWWQRLGDHLRR